MLSQLTSLATYQPNGKYRQKMLHFSPTILLQSPTSFLSLDGHLSLSGHCTQSRCPRYSAPSGIAARKVSRSHADLDFHRLPEEKPVRCPVFVLRGEPAGMLEKRHEEYQSSINADFPGAAASQQNSRNLLNRNGAP